MRPTTTPAATPALLLEWWDVEVVDIVVEVDVDEVADAAIVRTTVEPPTVTVTGTADGEGAIVVDDEDAYVEVEVDEDVAVDVGVEDDDDPEEDELPEDEDDDEEDEEDEPDTEPTLLVIPVKRTVHALVPPPVSFRQSLARQSRTTSNLQVSSG